MMGRAFGKRSAIRAASAAIFYLAHIARPAPLGSSDLGSADASPDTLQFVGIILSRSCKWRVVVGNPIAVGSGECANIAYRSCWYKNITFSEHLQHDHGALARQTWPRCACAPEIFTLAWHTYVQYV